MRTRVANPIKTLPLLTTFVHVTRSSAQSIAAGASTPLVHPTVLVDRLSEYNTTTGIFTAKNAGYYLVSASCEATAFTWPAGSYWITSVEKNSVLYIANYSSTGVASTTTEFMVGSVRGTIKLAAGDTVRVAVQHTSGSAVNTGALADRFFLQIYHLAGIS